MLFLSAGIGATAMIAFTVFLLTGPWRVVDLYKGTRAVLAFDLFLSLLFFVQHSGMVRRSFKAWFSRFAPEAYHGAVYSVASGLCLYAVVLFWQESQLVLASADGPFRVGMHLAFFAAAGGIVWSNLVLHSFDSFGLRAIRSHMRGRPQAVTAFSERGPYRWVRHPQYFLVLVMIWSYPDLTADRLLFNLLWSLWVVVGAYWEERDLAVTFGDTYRDYQSRVPMLIPYRPPR